MNIIKLKDIIMHEDNSISELYNTYLKGRYAYWIQMRYIVPFDFMRHEGYVACESDINKLLKKEDGTYPKPYGCPYIDMYSEDRCIIKYIDINSTDNANNISKFKLENESATDDDITLEMIKKFRTWLAQTLLDLDDSKDSMDNNKMNEIERHTMQYYANNMYDDILKFLILYNDNMSYKMNTTRTSCSCCSNESLNNLMTLSSVCDPILLYKKNIYDKMVEMFSDILFWMNYPTKFLQKFKQYIDNIINTGLKINNTKSDYISVYKDCTCNNNEESNNINILKRLSESINYIITSNINSHKNFIHDALYDWASLLYEFMQW